MKEIAKRWLEFAQDDFKAASILFANKAYRECIYHCHQALEKTIKAIIVQRGERLRKTHDLAGLINDSGLSASDSILQFIEKLNPHYIPIRYPDATTKRKFRYTKATAKKFLKGTKEIIKWLGLQLMQLK